MIAHYERGEYFKDLKTQKVTCPECSDFTYLTIPKIIILGIVNTVKNTPGLQPCVFDMPRDILKVLGNKELALYL